MTISGLAVLDHESHRISRPQSSVIAARMAATLHALHEITTGRPPTGRGGALFRPHSHMDGIGVSIPRGVICAYDSGEQPSWSWAGGPGVWLRRPVPPGIAPSPTDASGDLLPPDMLAYVTPGIDSTRTAILGGPCYLEAMVYAKCSIAAASLRFRNRDTSLIPAGAYSSTLVIAGGPPAVGWLHFVDIPCVGGAWNRLDIEVDAANIYTIEILSVVIAETRAVSQPASAGLHTMAAAPRP